MRPCYCRATRGANDAPCNAMPVCAYMDHTFDRESFGSETFAFHSQNRQTSTIKHLVFPQPSAQKCTHSDGECPVGDFLFRGVTLIVSRLPPGVFGPVRFARVSTCPRSAVEI